MADLEDVIKKLLQKRKEHELKWELPELKMSAPIKSADVAIPVVKKVAKFVSGGEFADEVWAKQFSEGIYAFFVVRVEQNTGQETTFFEGYQIEETVPLGVELYSRYQFERNLPELGYQQAFNRKLRVWNFLYKMLPLQIFDIEDFGSFAQVSLPPTKIASARELNRKNAQEFFKKIGMSKDEILPVDVITLQFYALLQAAQQPGQEGGQEKEKGLF